VSWFHCVCLCCVLCNHWHCGVTLTYRQPVCHTVWNEVWSEKRRENTLRHNTQHHSKEWFVCLLLAMCTCIVWKKCFPTFFQIIGHHFKRSVNTLIVHAWSGVHCVLSHVPTQLQSHLQIRFWFNEIMCFKSLCSRPRFFFYSYIETAMEESLMMLQEGAINTSIVTL